MLYEGSAFHFVQSSHVEKCSRSHRQYGRLNQKGGTGEVLAYDSATDDPQRCGQRETSEQQ